MLARFSLRLAVLAALLCVAPSPALAQRDSQNTKNSSRVLEAFRDVVARVNGSVVRVVDDGKDVALGTVVGSDGRRSRCFRGGASRGETDCSTTTTTTTAFS